MKWKEVSKEEYQKVFRQIRRLIAMIEHDPRLRWEGFELKQQVRECVRTLVKVEKELFKSENAEL